MESGLEMPEDRIAGFLSGLARASEIVIADGLLFALLLPCSRVRRGSAPWVRRCSKIQKCEPASDPQTCT